MTQLPVYLQNRQAPKLAQNMLGHLGAGSPPFISIMSNRFTLIDAAGDEQPVETYDPKLGPYLDCVIVDACDNMSKIYYDKPFDPNAGQYEPPVCFSDNGIGPSRNASKPQARTCAECPNSAWGSKTSAVSGKGVKACSDFQKLAIMIPGDEVLFLLRVPPNSLSNLRAYMQKFGNQQVDVCDVLTRISFVAGTIGTLKFDAINYVDEASFKRREQVMASKVTDNLVGRTDQPRPAELGPPAPTAQLPPPQQPLMTTGVAQFTPPSAAPLQTVSQPAPQSPSASAPAPSGRRRRNTAQAAPQATPGMPAQAAPFQQSPAGTNGGFGMQQPQPAPSGLDQTLDSLFGPGA